MTGAAARVAPAPVAEDRRAAWSRPQVTLLVLGVSAGIAIRLLLLPTPGFRDDLDQFVVWAQRLATMPLGRAYELDLSFPPVMVYIWWLLGQLLPAIRTATDATDATVAAAMKLPAMLADLGLAAGVALALRDRRWLAVAGALAILLHPAVIDVSSWWGQYESIYVLAALIAFLFAAGDRPYPAAAALAVSLMSKPQALPLLVPFAAFAIARWGPRRALGAALALVGTSVLLWLPFLAAGGPLAYLRSLGAYQDTFAVLSLRAWNPWWLFQEWFAGGSFISDGASILGPISLRTIGLGLAGLAELALFVAILRRPSPAALALGLAAATLVGFVLLTTMHERYAYAALVFLLPLLADRRVGALWLLLSATFTLNLIAAVPPVAGLRDLVPIGGPLGALGSIAMTVVTILCVALLAASPTGDRTPSPSPERPH